jgi:hypothetical protein
MSFSRAQFLIEVLGPKEALALAKAAERHENLNSTLVPRSILAWLGAIPGFEGEIPGLPGSMLSFAKSEGGFTGECRLSDGLHKFQDMSIFHVAGAVATAMELEDLTFGNMRNVELTRLGQTIDLMAKVRFLAKAIPASDHGHEESSPADEGGEKSRQEIYEDPEMKKEEGGTGQTAAPVAPAPPAAPTPTSPKGGTTKQPSAKTGAAPPSAGMKSVKMTRSEAAHKCSMCGLAQFEGDKFTGCSCFRELAKTAKVTASDSDSITLSLPEIDSDTLVTLFEAIGRK